MKMTSFYRFITIAALAFSLSACASKAESEPVVRPSSAAEIADAVRASEELFKQRAEVAKLREAVRKLAAVRNPDERNFEVEWKFARFSFFLGKQVSDEKEKEKIFDEGEKAGRIASRIEPARPEGYFWYAANLGERAKMSPVTVGVKAVADIREAMNKVIEIEPGYQSASAYDALAQIELQTAGIMGGKPEKAVELLEKAIAINGDNSYLRLHLGEAYLATGKKPEARRQLETLLKMKPDPDYAIEFNETAEKAKKLLETKF